MSLNDLWDTDQHREEHESDEQWQLRRAFMVRWRNNFSEERLVCLARVFANIEFLGCRYPNEIMQEIAYLSEEIAKEYRQSRKGKLQRTFVSASLAAVDRAKGIKRKGGVVKTQPVNKTKINFVPQGQNSKENEDISIIEDESADEETNCINSILNEKKSSDIVDFNEYMTEMSQVKCMDVRRFNERMFFTSYGKMVLLIRPWASKLQNIMNSCQVCNIEFTTTFEDGLCCIALNRQLIGKATGSTKAEAKSAANEIVWNRLRNEVVSVLEKEQWIAHGDSRISVSDISGRKRNTAEFGTPVASSVAAKMMQMMGWKGGGLGADSQGIAEPIKPKFQMVNRAGLGHSNSDIRQLCRAGTQLMQRYIASDTLGVDLVFSSDFTKDERAQLHKCAQKQGLSSKSYGSNTDRFLVVRKKMDPYSLVRAVIEKGGNTPKYQVFIPLTLCKNKGR